MAKFKRLPDSELEVMLIIWQGGEAVPTGEILQRMGDGKKCSLQSVQSTLNRLVDKGFVRCDKLGRLNHYTPLVDVDEYKSREAASFLEKLYDNSPTKLLATLLRSKSISEEEVEELKKILDERGS